MLLVSDIMRQPVIFYHVRNTSFVSVSHVWPGCEVSGRSVSVNVIHEDYVLDKDNSVQRIISYRTYKAELVAP